MNMGLIHSIWTLLLVAIFIGIIAWAFQPPAQAVVRRSRPDAARGR